LGVVKKALSATLLISFKNNTCLSLLPTCSITAFDQQTLKSLLLKGNISPLYLTAFTFGYRCLKFNGVSIPNAVIFSGKE